MLQKFFRRDKSADAINRVSTIIDRISWCRSDRTLKIVYVMRSL
ncbi:hypothetical protein [Desmonostoc muscorum]|nr:hypothetical protein [Desmonostoc muscorum]